jgi:serine/threonine-protein kinase RsbW
VDVAATLTADVVEIRVADQGTWRQAGADVSRGRGLQLIRQVMDHVAIDHAAGTTVTMRRRIRGKAS